jgi:hypothetical protein
MSNMKNALFILAALIFVTTLISPACKKDPAPTPTGNLVFHIHTNIDTNEVDAGVVAADAYGRHFQLNVAELLISGVQLKKTDGSFQTVDNVYILKTIDQEVYTIGSVPAGNYVSVRFNVGVDAAANAKAPSAFSSPNPLADAANWFGTTAQGYIFANLQGKADVTVGQTGPVDQSFSYQLGTSTMLKTVSLPDKAFTVVAKQDNFVHLTADYGIMLQGVDFKTQSTGTPVSNTGVAQKIADNIPNMFRYEE